MRVGVGWMIGAYGKILSCRKAMPVGCSIFQSRKPPTVVGTRKILERNPPNARSKQQSPADPDYSGTCLFSPRSKRLHRRAGRFLSSSFTSKTIHRVDQRRPDALPAYGCSSDKKRQAARQKKNTRPDVSFIGKVCQPFIHRILGDRYDHHKAK